MDTEPYGMAEEEDYRDVTSVFASASQEMEPGSMITIDVFSLSDAMTAIEIGDPRLDTGMQLEVIKQPDFDPLTPLLPEEICWIIDHSMAYETQWHASNPLAHTVFTLLYAHCLYDVDPDIIPSSSILNWDSSRPLELITIVIRAYTSALLKSCSLAWNELSKGTLPDNEDWHSDKSEVSLLEGWPVEAAVARLDSALKWLSKTTQVPPLWQEAIKIRLQFRRHLIVLLSSTESLPRNREDFENHLHAARHCLSIIRLHRCESISSTSAAHAAFDPHIARRLNTFLPVRIVDIPSWDQTCDAYERLLNGWEDIDRLSTTHDISTWNQAGFHQSWFTAPAARPAYIRSCVQTLFFDGNLIVHSQPQGWVINRLFEETIGLSYNVFSQHWGGSGFDSLAELERRIIHTVIPHMRGLWNNPPRRRRFLVKTILDWHMVYDALCVLVEDLDTTDMDPVTFRTLNQFPKAIVLWRLTTIREVILSGFQVELYHPLERPFAYWFAAQVIDVHLNQLDMVSKGMAGIVPQNSPSRKEIHYQHVFLVALQAMCMTMFINLVRSFPTNTIFTQWEQLRTNLCRRYKWAFNPAYDVYEFEPVVLEPDFTEFLKEVQDAQNQGQGHGMPKDLKKKKAQRHSSQSPTEYLELALKLLRSLISTNNTGSLDGHWIHDRMQLLQGMSETCQELQSYLSGSSLDGDSSRNPVLRLDWARSFSESMPKTPWFPSVRRVEGDVAPSGNR